jgi:hypothetical protein
MRLKLPNSPELPQTGKYADFVPRFYALWRMLRLTLEDIVTTINNIDISGGVTDGDKGDITVTSSGTVWTIDNEAVTYAKIQDVDANSYLGRADSSAGPVQEIALDTSELAGRGSSGNLAAIQLGTGLTMTGTTLSASGSDSPVMRYGPPCGWFVADDLGAFRSDTDSVTPLWQNRIPSYWDMNPQFVASGQEPVYRTGIRNGHGVVRFDGGGTGDLFITNSTEDLSIQFIKQATVFAVLSPDSATASLGLCSKGQSSPEYDLWVPNATNAFKLWTSGGSTVASVAYGSNPVAGDWYICTYQVSLSSFIRVWRNGGTKAQSTSFSGSMTFNNDNWRLGRLTNSVTFFDGDLAEFIWYPRALTFEQIDAIHDYLAEKYNITVTPVS